MCLTREYPPECLIPAFAVLEACAAFIVLPVFQKRYKENQSHLHVSEVMTQLLDECEAAGVKMGRKCLVIPMEDVEINGIRVRMGGESSEESEEEFE